MRPIPLIAMLLSLAATTVGAETAPAPTTTPAQTDPLARSAGETPAPAPAVVPAVVALTSPGALQPAETAVLAPATADVAASPTAPPPHATDAAIAPQPSAPPDLGAAAAPAVPAIDLRDDQAPLATIDLTVPPSDLWQRVRNGFSMPNLDNPQVAKKQAWFLNHPELLQRIVLRSRRYLYHIVDELDRRGMPMELALLPMIESAYNPMAYSRARALGIWQFIPSTGKSYRLEQNWWLDQRRDIVASTNAALDYLQNIYELNGDWHLALASYNWGENGVARAVAKNKAKHLPTDYSSLKMPRETSYYVPKLQALKNIIAQPELFGIELDPVPNQPYFGRVDKPADMDVTVAADLAEIPMEELIALNPAYNRPVMPANKGSPLLVPADKVDIFRANLLRREGEDKTLNNWETYSLKKGEKLDNVAARYGIAPARLRQINGITARTKVAPGHALLVPGKDARASVALLAANLPAPLPERRAGRHHKHSGKSRHKHAAAVATAKKKHVATLASAR